MENESAMSVTSVGDGFEQNQIYTLEHPKYQAFEAAVGVKLQGLAARETARRSKVRPLMVTVSVSTEEVAVLAKLFPEFNVLVTPINSPGHRLWNAMRVLANELIAVRVSKYTDTYLHEGVSLLSMMSRGARQVHSEYDPTSYVARQDAHASYLDAYRLFGDYESIRSSTGVLLPREEYNAHLLKQAYQVCTTPSTCTHAVDAVCADLSRTAYTPTQFAISMLQHKATIGFGFLIYHPSMLTSDFGELCGTGVHFSRTETHINFQYTEGVSGVSEYSLDMWGAWLTCHSFYVGETPESGKWFHVELEKARGPFMVFRMVKLEGRPDVPMVTHALDLPVDEPMDLVSSWKLKSLHADPMDANSWVRYRFLAPTRLIARTYEHAMQMKKSDFSRYAVRKQVSRVNDRWVTHGTNVTVQPPLSPDMLGAVTSAVFAKAFCDRYEMSQLSAELMNHLKDVVRFYSFSPAQRLASVAMFCVRSAWYYTGAYLNDAVRWMCDSIREFLHRTPPELDVSVRLAPAYFRLEEVAGVHRSGVSAALKVLLTRPAEMRLSDVVNGGVGGAMSTLLATRGVAVTTSDDVHVHRTSTDLVDMSLRSQLTDDSQRLIDVIASLNPLDSEPHTRQVMEVESVVTEEVDDGVVDYQVDEDPANTLSTTYENAVPGVAEQDLEFDTASLSLDPQDRNLAAPYLKMPKYFGLPPAPRMYYRSRIGALNVPKRQQTGQEMLSALSSRNMSAPNVSLPQEQDVLIKDVWDTFLKKCCVADAKKKCELFQNDPVAMGADALSDWAAQAKPGVVDRVVKELQEQSKTMDEYAVGDYIAMLKADVKPTLSRKPIETRTDPQTIVYHEKPLSAMYSSIFRVIVRRFQSILKPNYYVNLLKDMKDIRRFVNAIHPFGRKNLKYLENDFSKYDKSQLEFAFAMEAYWMGQLGMNLNMLHRWTKGHIECSLHSFMLGMSLHLMYQRKSGDATTAFGNVVYNILTVTYAYKSSVVIWAIFMGDDSLVCCAQYAMESDSIRIMSELFNLVAKNYVTEAPYFASNFFVIDDDKQRVSTIPDPIKRIERLSMHVSADEPQWRERHVSLKDSLGIYSHRINTEALPKLVSQRYTVAESKVRGAVSALATIVHDFDKFRDLWEAIPTLSLY